MTQGEILVTPIKCQGKKTRLIPFIRENIHWDGRGRWIEPFLGSGAVVFNIKPQHALLIDRNEHVINFYRGIQQGRITPASVRAFLEKHGEKLRKGGSDYYLEMREAFNKSHAPLHFLFLNRAGFNGLIRFNRQGNLNVPFCKNPDRFSRAYVTKICNQVQDAADVLHGRDWIFHTGRWQLAFEDAERGDYIYLDPPYIGRNTNYVGEWPAAEAVLLAEAAHKTPANVCLSMWKCDEFKRNEHLYQYWQDFHWYTQDYHYFVGGPMERRHNVTEMLAIKNVSAQAACSESTECQI